MPQACKRSDLVTRALLRTAPGQCEDIEVEFKYNPPQFVLDKNVPWQSHDQLWRDIPILEFTAGDAATLSLELMFDEYESGLDVRACHTDKLTRMAHVNPSKGHPPLIVLAWGANEVFRGVITKLNLTFSMFRADDGIPTRAKATVTLCQAETLVLGDGEEKEERAKPRRGKVAQVGASRADQLDARQPRRAMDSADGEVDERGCVRPGAVTSYLEE
jgi:hypothetical protein